MNKTAHTASSSGQSLIELLVGMTIMVIVLTAAALLATKSIQLSQLSLLRKKAVILAKEGIEQARKERDTKTWNDFAIDSLEEENDIDGNFTRKILKTVLQDTLGNPRPIVHVVVEVSWIDVKGDHTVTQQTYLSKWQ
ncbi:MAG: type IV pilus modification PilV family protein [Patescibacteria group bacterium]|jgi:type II secretory pathway pseudopilin PulG